MSKTLTSLAISLTFTLAGPARALPSPEIHGDSVDSLEYIPMAVGNSWIYGSVGISADTQECSVFDTARVAGRLYFLHSGPTLEQLGNWSSPVDSLRSDTLLRIWRRDKGLEYMLFDFSHGDYPSYTTYPEVDTVRVTQNVDVRAPAGHFTNCIDLYFPRHFLDESIGYTFAPGVGIVRFYGPFFGIHNLLRARINGKIISSIDNRPEGPLNEFVLAQNYPNPFNPTTTIQYALPQRSHVTLSIYNTLGQLVTTLVSGEEQAGSYEVKFDSAGLTSGVYFYRLKAGSFVKTMKCLILH